jgi:hypothetical protein
VSGGPTPDYNQYAIESNARYVEKLTARTSSKRILFADGRKASRTIVAQSGGTKQEAEDVFAWLFDTDPLEAPTTYRASTLSRIDGPANRRAVLQNIGWLAGEAKEGQKSLLYFTGHGSPGQKRRMTFLGPRWSEDVENTTYALWGGSNLSVHEVAGALKNWPKQTPLVLLMVQCHAGGFANLLFEGGDPTKPLLPRDFCGFFAATGDRQASGCTPEVDETDYQDFTTHFFAALSGISRSGKPVTGADYDRNGTVSMLEAMTWTNLNDASIDVPVCTSDAYLRTLFPQSYRPNWMKTPYSTLLKSAAPWQKAALEGLSKQLALSGEGRIEAALQKQKAAAKEMEAEDTPFPISLDETATYAAHSRLKRELQTRFPALKSARASPGFKRARSAAVNYLPSRKADFEVLSRALKLWDRSSEIAYNREAMTWRFVRTTRTLFLEGRLQAEGTKAQKAAFARLRAAENRNPLR